MQSAEHHQQENSALALSKTFDHQENNGAAPVRPSLRSAGRPRGLGHAGGARDAPPLQRAELADDTRATPLDQLAALAAAQPPALKVDASQLRRRAGAVTRASATKLTMSTVRLLRRWPPRTHRK